MADAVFAALTRGIAVRQPPKQRDAVQSTASLCFPAPKPDRIVQDKPSNKRKRQPASHGLINPFDDTETPQDAQHTGDPAEAANLQRKRHKIKVVGTHVPPPLSGFGQLATQHLLNARVLSNLHALGHAEPTPIQRQAVPALLGGRDLLAVAPTGSGKTLSFLLPMVALVTPSQSPSNPPPTTSKRTKGPSQGPQGPWVRPTGIQGLVVSPTRELSAQTYRELLRLTQGTGVRCCLLQKNNAAGTEFDKVQLLCSTPLLLDRLITKKRCDLSSCRMLVLDEADRLFEMGFLQQIDIILNACTNTNLVRCLFSATLPEKVEDTARSVLRDPLRVTVGIKNTATSNVKQQLVFVGQEKGRLLALRQLLKSGLEPPILVFVNTKERAKELHRELMYDGGIRVDSIHADQDAAQRTAAVDNFRAGRTWVLIATDLLGRGMDFLGIKTVVNYDMPSSTTDYIHRIGRTGRGGRKGTAISLFVEEDARKMRGIANLVKAVGSEVPEWLLALPKKPKHRKRAKQKMELLEDEGEE